MSGETQEKKLVPALPELLTWTEDGVHLISAKCGSCGTYFFPWYHEQHRPNCSRKWIEKIFLNKRGSLTSYTIQYFMPPPPFKTDRNITPYIVGLVEFPEGIQVTGIVVDCPFNDLKVGLTMETTTFTLYRDDQMQEVVTWAFRPVEI